MDCDSNLLITTDIYKLLRQSEFSRHTINSNYTINHSANTTCNIVSQPHCKDILAYLDQNIDQDNCKAICIGHESPMKAVS